MQTDFFGGDLRGETVVKDIFKVDESVPQLHCGPNPSKGVYGVDSC